MNVIMETFWQSLGQIGNTIMEPLYWVVSAVMVGAHALWSNLFGANSGLSWTLSIITLTVIIRLAMLPLFFKQLLNSRDMQTLQPRIKELQKKYGHDQVKLGQETQKLYRDEGVNPMASCLPMFIQMPFFLALFWVLNGAARGTPKGAWLVDRPDLVSSLQHANLFGAELSAHFVPMPNGFGATQVLVIILVVVMVAVLLFQQLQMLRRNIPPESLEGPMGQQQKLMVYLFPFIYLVSGMAIPIGVLLYWLTSNVWTLAQQMVIIRRYPTPNTPAYVEWEERMVAQGRDPKAIEAERRAKRSRAPKVAPATVVPEGEKQTVARQKVATRTTTVQRQADGKQVITRQQPQRQSRSQRKKN